MSAAQFSIAALVLLPLLSAGLAILLPRLGQRAVGLVTGFGIAGFTAWAGVQLLADGTQGLELGGYAPPVGIALRFDGFSAAFMGLSALIGLAVSLYAAADQRTPAGFWPLWLACWAGINTVFVSGDLFNTYVGLELVTLTAVALVAISSPKAWEAAFRYLIVAVLGSMLFLVGIGVLLSATGTLDMVLISQQLGGESSLSEQGSELAGGDLSGGDPQAAALFGLGLMSAGICLKIAVVPVHGWLIRAHSSAATAVSPILSGLVIKTGLFVLLRCWIWVIPPNTLRADPTALVLAGFLGALGVLAVSYGSVQALRQPQLKALIAYSTIAQLGYWLLGIPLLITTEDTGLVLTGITALALGHGVAKAALFLAAGYLKDHFGTDTIATLRGAGQEHSIIVMSIGLAAVGLIGLPISLGFSGKWLLLQAALDSGQWWLLATVIIGTLASAGYMFSLLSGLMRSAEATPEDEDPKTELPAAVEERNGGGAGPQQALKTPQNSSGTTTQPATFPDALRILTPLGLGTAVLLTGFLGAALETLLRIGLPG